jgi:hypothetical protein
MRFSLAILTGSIKGISLRSSRSDTLNISAPKLKKVSVLDGNSFVIRVSPYPPSTAMMISIGFFSKGSMSTKLEESIFICSLAKGSLQRFIKLLTASSLIILRCPPLLAYSDGLRFLRLVYPNLLLPPNLLLINCKTVNLNGYNKRIRIRFHSNKTLIRIRAKTS